MSQRGDEPGSREGHSLTHVGSLLYLFGGSDGAKEFNDLHTFDPKTFTWKLSEYLFGKKYKKTKPDVVTLEAIQAHDVCV